MLVICEVMGFNEILVMGIDPSPVASMEEWFPFQLA
jgi:hypothetical protein